MRNTTSKNNTNNNNSSDDSLNLNNKASKNVSPVPYGTSTNETLIEKSNSSVALKPLNTNINYSNNHPSDLSCQFKCVVLAKNGKKSKYLR